MNDYLFPKEHIRNGTMIQFVSKNSHNLLQIVVTPSGSLTFDGNGAPNSFNRKNRN